MSKANAQATQTEAAARATDGKTAVVPAAQADQAPDEHHGFGGLYTVVDGVRRRVHATKPNHEKAKQ